MATIPTKKISELTTKTDTPTTETYVPVAEKSGETFTTKKYDLQRIYTAINSKLDATAKAADSDKLDGNDSTYFATAANLTAHTSNTNNPHNVTAAQLGAANILTQIKTVDGAGSGLDADLLDGKDSTYYAAAAHTHTINNITDLNRTYYINIILDAGGDIIGVGVIGDFVAPACTIIEAVLISPTSGSIEIELWKDTYDNFPPTSADKITAASPLKLVSSMKSKDTNLTGWTTSINQGDIIRVVVNSCEGISKCTLSLKVIV